MLKVKFSTQRRAFANSKNSQNTTDPALIAEFTNSAFVKEEKTPLFYSILQGAVRNESEVVGLFNEKHSDSSAWWL